MFAKLLIAFLVTGLALTVALMGIWNLVFTQLPIKGITFEHLSFQNALSMAFSLAILFSAVKGLLEYVSKQIAR